VRVRPSNPTPTGLWPATSVQCRDGFAATPVGLFSFCHVHPRQARCANLGLWATAPSGWREARGPCPDPENSCPKAASNGPEPNNSYPRNTNSGPNAPCNCTRTPCRRATPSPAALKEKTPRACPAPGHVLCRNETTIVMNQDAIGTRAGPAMPSPFLAADTTAFGCSCVLGEIPNSYFSYCNRAHKRSSFVRPRST
jgi:hypothetical protein